MLKRLKYILPLILTSNIVSAQCKQNIHLTFDDGPLLSTTPKVFDALKEHDIKATFFVNTHYINSGQVKLGSAESDIYKKVLSTVNNHDENKKRRWLLKKIKDAGHKIGSHGFGHFSYKESDPSYPDSNLRGDWQRKRNIELSTNVLKGFQSPPYTFRLPYGKPFKSDRSGAPRRNVNQALSKDYDINLGWTTDPEDWKADKAYNRAKTNWSKNKIKKDFIKASADALCKSGGIAVFHDNKKLTAESIGDIIKEVKRRGGRFVDFSTSMADSTQIGAIETLSPSAIAFCRTRSKPQPVSQVSNELSDDIFNIFKSSYGKLVNEYSTSEGAHSALNQISYGSKCIVQASTKSSKYDLRCKNRVVYSNQLNQDDYPRMIGSYAHKDNANKVIQDHLHNGSDCEVFPIITAEGRPFNRVRCK